MLGSANPMSGKTGAANPNWGGGKTVDSRFGYVLIRKPDHSRAHKYTGYVYEHILAAEKKLGRPILDSERVHHIDGNPRNNVPDNLAVLSGDREHAAIHNDRRQRNGLGQYS